MITTAARSVLAAVLCFVTSACALVGGTGGLPPPSRTPTPGESAALKTIDRAELVAALTPAASAIPGAEAIAAPIGNAIDDKADALRLDVAALRAEYDAKYAEIDARNKILTAERNAAILAATNAADRAEAQLAADRADAETAAYRKEMQTEESRRFYSLIVASGIGLINLAAGFWKRDPK
jgi:hypothetical protein